VKDPGGRYQTVEALISDLKQFQNTYLKGAPVDTMIKDPSPMKRTTEQVIAPKAVVPSSSDDPSRGKKINLKPIGMPLLLLILMLAGYHYKEDILSAIDHIRSNTVSPLSGSGNLVKETERQLKDLELADEHYHLGVRYRDLGDAKRAVDEFQKAISGRPDYPQYRKELALAYESQNMAKEAIAAWEDVIKLDKYQEFTQNALIHIDQLLK